MNEGLSLSATGLEFIAAHEGFRSTAYRDAAGLETIGYGHRLIEGESFPNGVSDGDARRLLAADTTRAETAIRALVAIALTQPQFDALTSFVFNVGIGAFVGATLLRELNAANIDAAADQFLRWNKITIDGVLTADPGLTDRRAAERRLFLGA